LFCRPLQASRHQPILRWPTPDEKDGEAVSHLLRLKCRECGRTYAPEPVAAFPTASQLCGAGELLAERLDKGRSR